jgi:GGDEF domain-containing protein
MADDTLVKPARHRASILRPQISSGVFLLVVSVLFCCVLALFVGSLIWQLKRLETAVAVVSSAVAPQLLVTYQLSSDLASLSSLTSQLADRQTFGEVQTIYETMQSRSEAVGWHLTSLRLAGIPEKTLSQAVRIHGDLSDDSKTIYTLVQQRLALLERLATWETSDPQLASAKENIERVQQALVSLNRRISNLVSREAQVAAQLTPMISTLTSHIQARQNDKVAENSVLMDRMIRLLILSSVALALLFAALALVLRQRLVVRLRQLRRAMQDWKEGIAAPMLPQGRDEIADMGRLLLDLTDAIVLTPQSGGVIDGTEASLGLLARDGFVGALSGACATAKKANTPVWLFLGQIEGIDEVYANLGQAVGAAVARQVARHWAFIGGADCTAGYVSRCDLGLFVHGLSGEEAAALATSLRQMISDTAVRLRGGGVVPVRLFVGYDYCLGGAEGGGDPMEGLLARADNALMADKKK